MWIRNNYPQKTVYQKNTPIPQLIVIFVKRYHCITNCFATIKRKNSDHYLRQDGPMGTSSKLVSVLDSGIQWTGMEAWVRKVPRAHIFSPKVAPKENATKERRSNKY